MAATFTFLLKARISALLLALFVFTAFIGSSASLLGNLWSGRAHKARQLWLRRQYLQQMYFSNLCAAKKIDAYLHYALGKCEHEASADRVEILKHLSILLRDELKAEATARACPDTASSHTSITSRLMACPSLWMPLQYFGCLLVASLGHQLELRGDHTYVVRATLMPTMV